MKLATYASNFFDIEDEAVVIFCAQSEAPTGDILNKIDILTAGAVSEMFAAEEFNGAADTIVLLRRVPETTVSKVILAGIGNPDGDDWDAYRRAAARAGSLARKHKVKSLAFYYDGAGTNQTACSIIEGFMLGTYRFLDYKTDEKVKKGEFEEVSIVIPSRNRLKQAENGMSRGNVIAQATIHCRDLMGTPANDLYPESYANHVQDIAKEFGIKCRVLKLQEIRKEKMGALLAVAAGSNNDPRFVILEYNGKGKDKPVVLVGKGVTFDSGGISLKPGLDMGEMKGDMTGSAVILMTIMAAAQLKAKVNLVGLMPLVENMPSGHATRPGDIINSRGGFTVEIINTDAEGRLILADALDFADQFKPQAVIDIATLTGAAQYILGYEGAPFVGTNQKLNDNLRAAALRTAERIWELPLWPEFGEHMKSDVADLKNSYGRPAGTLTAASFLKYFTKDWPWAHIDIAYCDIKKSAHPYVPKGSWGFGVRLLTDLILNWKKL